MPVAPCSWQIAESILQTDLADWAQLLRPGGDPLMDPRFIEAVLARSDWKLETLPAEFFRELARRFGPEARFLFVYRGDRVVGFLNGVAVGPEYHLFFVGVDYQVNADTEMYFNLICRGVDDALRHGAQRIFLGATSEGFKLRIGCFQQRRHLFVKGHRGLRRLLPLARGILFPPVPLREPHNMLRAPTAPAGE